MTQELTIDVPKALWMSSNDRPHWADKARRTRQLRTLAGWQARNHLAPVTGRVRVIAHVSRPTRSRADAHNAMPTIKPLIDGLTDAGIWPDDSDAHIEGPDARPAESTGIRGMYRIRIVITPVTPN